MIKVLLLALLCNSLHAVDAGDQKKAGEASQKPSAIRAWIVTLGHFLSEAGGLKPINKIKKAIRENNAAALCIVVMTENNLGLTDETGYTPLMLAAESNRPELVKLLLSLEHNKIAATKDSSEAAGLRQAAARNKEKARVIAEKYGFKDVISLLSNKSVSLMPSAQAGTATIEKYNR